MMARGILIFLCISLGLAGLAWLNRVDLILNVVKWRTYQQEIAPHREVAWQQGPHQARKSSSERPPNIIYILADDLGYNDISTFGGGVADGQVQTPGIDALAALGAVFEQSYAGNATCAPSRAMILTGRYPTRTGFEFTPTPTGMMPVVGLVNEAMDSGLPSNVRPELEVEGLPFQDQGLPSSELTIAEVLKEQGYYTAHIGKWHLGTSPGFRATDQGFDDSLLMSSGLFLPEDDPNVVNAKLDFDPIDKFLWVGMRYAAAFNSGSTDSFEPGGYLTDYWTDEAIKVIENNRHRPFFLYLAHWGVHTPLQATKEDYEAVGDIKPHRLRVYAAMVRALDRSVGRINQKLADLGLAENTIVMFSSDNGGPGYVGLPDINEPYRGWKLTFYEGGVRVPAFVKWPDQIKPGTRIQTPVTHVDVLPTLAAAAGATLPEGLEIDGVNIMPLAKGSDPASWSRENLFWQSGPYQVVRHNDWKLHSKENLNTYRLYNLAEDPTEQIDLSKQSPLMLAKLKGILADHLAQGKGPLYPHQVEMTVAVDKTRAERFEEGDEYIRWPN